LELSVEVNGRVIWKEGSAKVHEPVCHRMMNLENYLFSNLRKKLK